MENNIILKAKHLFEKYGFAEANKLVDKFMSLAGDNWSAIDFWLDVKNELKKLKK